jgi:opacity protein-like surface antigen
MKILKEIALATMAIAAMMPAKAADFIDASKPEKQIEIGARLGINTANQSVNFDEIFSNVKQGMTDWRTGFDAGVVVDLNLTNFFTLQPGFILQDRAYRYSVAAADKSTGALSEMFGSTRSTNLQIPMLASLRFNVAEKVRWQVDFGPYISLGLGGHNKIESYKNTVDNTAIKIEYTNYSNDFYGDSDGKIVGNKKFDWGLKMGTGFTYNRIYYFGIHYSAGCRNVGQKHSDFNANPNVKNKEWDFSIGYNF